MRLLLACFLLLVACAHTPSTAGPAPGPPAAAAPAPSATPAEASEVADRFSAVRIAAEALLRAQGEAAWRGWTSGEPTDQAALWKDRQALLDPAVLPQLGEAIASAAAPERARLERLRAFLLGEQLARATVEPTRALASARASSGFSWEKRQVPLRELPALLAGEPEAPRRRAAAEAWRSSVLKLEKLVAARDAALLRAGAERGFGSALALAGALRLDDPDRLAALAESTLADGDVAWPATLETLARRELGMSASRLREWDLPRLLRTTVDPGSFPADRLVAEVAGVATGLDLSVGGRLTIDAALRPGKIPRPLAVPVEVPGQVRLSVTPLAGLDAVRALLHEIGVALSLAYVRPTAPFEDRRLPPAWQTQAWGLLFEEIASDPVWLRAHGLSAEAAEREASLNLGRRVHATRAAAALVVTEVARGRDPAGAAARWGDLGRRAFGHPLDRGEPLPWRLEPDGLLRAADTLRARLLAPRLAAALTALAGDQPWWRSPAAGDWLRRTWAGGGGVVPEPLALMPGGGPKRAPPRRHVVYAVASR